MSELSIDTLGSGASTARADAGRAQRLGLDGLWFGDLNGDALDGVLAAATMNASVALGTAVTGAMVRSPMECAYRLADVHQINPVDIRFGIGAQARQVVRHQYGLGWEKPVRRLVEFRQAVQEIWRAWAGGEPPAFRGEVFRHVYTPSPCIPPISGAPPRVLLGATHRVGRDVAARYFDGLITHPCTPFRYLSDVIVPEFRAARASDLDARPELVSLTMVICIVSEERRAAMYEEMRYRLWFWAAAGVHDDVFDYLGLHELTREAKMAVRKGEHGKRDEMLTDEVVDEFCRIGDASEIGGFLDSDLRGVVDRTSVIFDAEVPEECAASLVAKVHAG